MMQDAHLHKVTRGLLWTKAVKSASTLYNITVVEKNRMAPYKRFVGCKPKFYNSFIQFWRVAYVAKGNNIKATGDLCVSKMIVAGYLANKSNDTYCLFNPATRQIIESRNIKWGNWPYDNGIPIASPKEVEVHMDPSFIYGPALSTYSKTQSILTPSQATPSTKTTISPKQSTKSTTKVVVGPKTSTICWMRDFIMTPT